ncbi:uncharacterized protein LOC125878149 [Solanum stenotomum]|uniref:uncharacterized protein LOC125878149 n=1 Tax=Solanum stenotomum TaxID=172797 RepID=UPI0020D03C4E|nr:uncharacterized protein LOC125878149 [Solanum stenotomum]
MEHAKFNVRGTHEHGYAVLNAYCYMLEVANPGSKTTLSLDENGRFKYFFVSYVTWITGFQEMRKVVAVDGTFLRSKYEGVLVSTVNQDAEKHIFPVAFCVVDKECDVSYEYFFQNMRSFVDDTDELCIISDRHPSIRKMVSTIYPASHYGCCMKHLGENIRNNFHNSKVVTHFYKAAKAYDRCEFNDHYQIRNLVPKAAETLERIGFHTWSRAFCPGNRYNIMTSNIAKSVNSMFDVEREFPIVALFDEINRRFALLFHQRHMELVNSANRFVPSIEKDISKYVNAGNKLLAHQIANYKCSVTGHDDVAMVDVQRTCTCRIFDLHKIPCPHVMAVLRAQYGANFENPIYEYSSPYYSVKKYIMAYCEKIHPVPPKDSWIVPLDVIKREIPPPYVDQSKPGRRRYKRRRGYDFFKRSDSNGLGILSQAADGDHIGASYVLAIISIFNGGESMREGIMCMGDVCCLFLSDLCLMEGGLVTECMGSSDPPPFKKEW